MCQQTHFWAHNYKTWKWGCVQECVYNWVTYGSWNRGIVQYPFINERNTNVEISRMNYSSVKREKFRLSKLNERAVHTQRQILCEHAGSLFFVSFFFLPHLESPFKPLPAFTEQPSLSCTIAGLLWTWNLSNIFFLFVESSVNSFMLSNTLLNSKCPDFSSENF